MTVVTVGGRAFQVANLERRTVRHDAHLLALVARLGLDRLAPEDGEEAVEFGLRVMRVIIEKGAAAELAAAFLLPSGRVEAEWTAVLAADVQQHLESCDTQEDREAVYRLAGDAVLGFFRLQLRSLATSLSSLAGTASVPSSAAA